MRRLRVTTEAREETGIPGLPLWGLRGERSSRARWRTRRGEDDADSLRRHHTG